MKYRNVFILVLSFGLGYDFEDDSTFESRDWKGIIQIEQTVGSYSFGYWHSSQINNGLYGNPEDQNIIYIKKSFNLK